MPRIKRREKGDRRVEGSKVQLWTNTQTRRRLKAQAAMAGMSLGDYLGFLASIDISEKQLAELRQIAKERGTTVEVLLQKCIQDLKRTSG